MIQVMYTKPGYQNAKRTAPKDRTDEQHLLMNIDFRSGPNPVIRMADGKVRRIYPEQVLVGDTNYTVKSIKDQTQEDVDEEISEVSEDSDEAKEDETNLSADDFFNKSSEENSSD